MMARELVIPTEIPTCEVFLLVNSPEDGYVGARREFDSLCI